MGLFNYNNPVIKFMVKLANMMIVSFYWVICCLPLVTILPSCAGLYYATTRVVFKEGNGGGVTRAFFDAFKDACKPGILLSILADILAVLIYLGIITGLQTWQENLFWAFYLAAGFLIAFLLVSALIFLGPVLSRFSAGAVGVLRLAFYFSGRHIFRSILYLLLLVAMFLAVELFPLLLLLVPALYTDLIHGGVEKSMEEFIKSSQLEEAHGAEQKQA